MEDLARERPADRAAQALRGPAVNTVCICIAYFWPKPPPTKEI
jgi:hypothetical protein